ncbi:MAG: hypothetical protein K2G23_09905, partial [Muribaculaceae bacterium]|nr:hypothetical protein [Muribaculaceae bacterium]
FSFIRLLWRLRSAHPIQNRRQSFFYSPYPFFIIFSSPFLPLDSEVGNLYSEPLLSGCFHSN